jgi:hypothetical protein
VFLALSSELFPIRASLVPLVGLISRRVLSDLSVAAIPLNRLCSSSPSREPPICLFDPSPLCPCDLHHNVLLISFTHTQRLFLARGNRLSAVSLSSLSSSLSSLSSSVLHNRHSDFAFSPFLFTSPEHTTRGQREKRRTRTRSRRRRSNDELGAGDD